MKSNQTVTWTLCVTIERLHCRLDSKYNLTFELVLIIKSNVISQRLAPNVHHVVKMQHLGFVLHVPIQCHQIILFESI